MLRKFLSRQVVSTLQSSRRTFGSREDPNAPQKYNFYQALKLARCYSIAPFDESIDICVRLNVDPKHGEQVVKGTCIMPYGLGKSTIVAVYTTDDMKEKAKEAGADIIIDNKVLEDIKNGIVNFEKCLATPEVVSNLKPFAKILGPKGVMPNQKIGTLITVDKLVQVIKETKMGSVTFRVDQGKNVNAPLGKVSFNDDRIQGNLKAFMQKLVECKPPKIKGNYFLDAVLSTTMGPGWHISVDTIDPRHKSYLLV